MNNNYHLLAGILSLVINIMLPTLIYNFYLKPTIECNETVVSYAVLAVLSLLWMITLLISLRILGGGVRRIVNQNYCEKHLF